MASEVPMLVKGLRETFASDVTRSYEWRLKQLKTFQRMVTESQEELSEALYKDLHRSRVEANMYEISPILHEVQYAIDNLKDWMDPVSKPTNLLNLPGKSYVKFDPLGVVLILAPWNYPIFLLLGPLIGALAAGNVCLLRPANYSKHTSEVFVRIINKYFTPDVVAIVTGERDVTTACLQERFDLIFFTGGANLGRIVMEAAASKLTPVVLELGGKSPCIVDATCDIDITSKRLTWSTFANSGQTCVRPDYGLVHTKVADKLIEAMKQQIKMFYTRGNDVTEYAYNAAGASVDEEDNVANSPFFGRIINGGNNFQRLVSILQADAKYIVTGGSYDEKSLFIEPTILDYGTDVEAFLQCKAMSDELFGPIFPILRVQSVEECVPIIRTLEKPLAMYCFTTDSKVKQYITTHTTSGSLVFNDCMVQLANYHLPFGGVGMSGMGSYHGYYSFKTFSHEKSVLHKYNFMDVPARYPPYTTFKQSVMNMIAKPVSKTTKTVFTASTIVVAVAGFAWVCKEYILPAALPKIISALESLNSKL